MTGEFTIAVHALVYLNRKEEFISSEILAENVCTNSARIRKVMGKLKKFGIIATKEGLDGGYQMMRSPAKISLREIGEAVEAEFVSAAWKSGDQEKSCLITSGMADVMDGIYQNLNDLCKSRLSQITIADIDQQIFDNKK